MKRTAARAGAAARELARSPTRNAVPTVAGTAAPRTPNHRHPTTVGRARAGATRRPGSHTWASGGTTAEGSGRPIGRTTAIAPIGSSGRTRVSNRPGGRTGAATARKAGTAPPIPGPAPGTTAPVAPTPDTTIAATSTSGTGAAEAPAAELAGWLRDAAQGRIEPDGALISGRTSSTACRSAPGWTLADAPPPGQDVQSPPTALSPPPARSEAAPTAGRRRGGAGSSRSTRRWRPCRSDRRPPR